MQEKIIEITGINPVDVFGVNNKKFDFIKSFFPKLKIIARGNTVKINGSEEDILNFEDKFNLITLHLERYNTITDNQIERIVTGDSEAIKKSHELDDIIVHGNGGIKVKARTVNQRKMVKAVNEKDMVFAVGPAGTGKTYTAVALAVRALKLKQVRKIILTRPAVEAGENLGFLPGDLKEKLDPYLQPLYDGLRDMIPPEKLFEYLEQGIIEIAPLAFMRGRTLDHAFVILDEAQNTTKSQMKMFLTRMGRSAKFIVTGDFTQVDLPPKQSSGLINALEVLKNIDDIAVIELDGKDVIRHKLVRQIITAYDKNKNNEHPRKD